ncbi:MAG: HD domain-containing protein [Gemmatimonadetes bacterium]|nr:HD domain-containing protein [Gemmatimonadota bacterium]MBI3504515.1 HD domain-containing protein [Pseudomonadota bacterium]
MSTEAARFLNSFAQSLATMALYGEGHPARERVIDASYEHLQLLQEKDPRPQFSFLGYDVIYGQIALREMKEWDWGQRLANAGIQRLEFSAEVTRDEYEAFLDEVLARLTLGAIDSATRSPERRSTIKFGAIGVKGTEGVIKPEDLLPTATIQYSLGEEADTIRWLHDEVQSRGELPLIEAESVVRSLAVAMHGDRDIVIPLLQLKEFDQYTTTHSLNVCVLAMALAEFIGLGPKDVRGFGVAGLLHDLGKVRIPLEVLTKPGKLTDEEWTIMRRHPVDGARIIYESDRQLDLASAVAYEHHIMINGGGYPSRHFDRECHKASKLVHICDVYDALRTKRPYREAWESERVLAQIQSGAGPDFDAELATSFIQMMRQWERRVAVVDDKTPLPHMATGNPASGTPAAGTPAVAAPTVAPAVATPEGPSSPA